MSCLFLFITYFEVHYSELVWYIGAFMHVYKAYNGNVICHRIKKSSETYYIQISSKSLWALTSPMDQLLL